MRGIVNTNQLSLSKVTVLFGSDVVESIMVVSFRTSLCVSWIFPFSFMYVLNSTMLACMDGFEMFDDIGIEHCIPLATRRYVHFSTKGFDSAPVLARKLEKLRGVSSLSYEARTISTCLRASPVGEVFIYYRTVDYTTVGHNNYLSNTI
jgi:hypothetical protein